MHRAMGPQLRVSDARRLDARIASEKSARRRPKIAVWTTVENQHLDDVANANFSAPGRLHSGRPGVVTSLSQLDDHDHHLAFSSLTS
jgi:hypothetical protein